MSGYPMLQKCELCGGMIDEENDELSSCACDDGDDAVRAEAEAIKLGDWLWVKSPDDERLACVVGIGSNHLKLRSPEDARGRGTAWRIHFDEIGERLRAEPDAQGVIRDRIIHHQGEAQACMMEIQEICARLGFDPTRELSAPPEASASALVAPATLGSAKDYERDLVSARDTTLPELFKRLKEENAEAARWMGAGAIALKAAASKLDGVLDTINTRLLNVSLYAGLTERINQFADGAPAPINEKLHIMQRRLYMDEECLLDYRHGGMEFNTIGEFNAWLAKPKNRDRILPFPRCLVAMRVRRRDKDRGEMGGTLSSALIRMNLEDADKRTFLYIRNGERLYELECDLDFDELIFPPRSFALFNPAEPLMVKMFGASVEGVMGRSEWESMKAETARTLAEWEAQQKAKRGRLPPHDRYSLDDYKPFAPSNIYYDEAAAYIEKQVRYYNRIALIAQGLYDRSDVLHPHRAVATGRMMAAVLRPGPPRWIARKHRDDS